MKIIRILFHGLSLAALLCGVLAAGFDAIQSVSTSAVVMTSLGNLWLNLDPESLALLEMSASSRFGESVWRPYVTPFLAQPAFAVFFAVALIFWMAGYQAPRRVVRRRPRLFLLRR